MSCTVKIVKLIQIHFPLYTCIYTLYSMAHGYYIYMYEYIYKLHVQSTLVFHFTFGLVVQLTKGRDLHVYLDTPTR